MLRKDKIRQDKRRSELQPGRDGVEGKLYPAQKCLFQLTEAQFSLRIWQIERTGMNCHVLEYRICFWWTPFRKFNHYEPQCHVSIETSLWWSGLFDKLLPSSPSAFTPLNLIGGIYTWRGLRKIRIGLVNFVLSTWSSQYSVWKMYDNSYLVVLHLCRQQPFLDIPYEWRRNFQSAELLRAAEHALEDITRLWQPISAGIRQEATPTLSAEQPMICGGMERLPSDNWICSHCAIMRSSCTTENGLIISWWIKHLSFFYFYYFVSSQ